MAYEVSLDVRQSDKVDFSVNLSLVLIVICFKLDSKVGGIVHVNKRTNKIHVHFTIKCGI